MLLLLDKNNKTKLKKISIFLNENFFSHKIMEFKNNLYIGLEKPLDDKIYHQLKTLCCIRKTLSFQTPFKLASLEFQKEKTLIPIQDRYLGEKKFFIMAGPCAIENFDDLVRLGIFLKSLGVSVLRGSAFKPRSSPYSFQGHGKKALRWHKEAQKIHGLAIETEVMDTKDIDTVYDYVDIFRIGSRNMQNYSLLKEIGKTDKPVILKRGLASTVEEWLLSAEYILSQGNPHVILCERGIKTYDRSYRNTLDLCGAAAARTMTHLPIIIDPSHAAGREDLIFPLAKAALAIGADGLLIEVHPDPQKALSDGRQSLNFQNMEKLMKELKPLAHAVDRWI